MASMDGSNRIQESSDQFFDHVCGSCKTEGKENEARQYCKDCPEYLCDSCVTFHRKLPLLIHHNVVAASTVSEETRGRHLTVYCACNKNQEVEFYCEDHADVICSPCQSFRHHKCKTSSIQQKSSGYTSTKLNSILAKTKSLKDKYDQLKQECNDNKTGLTRSKEACMKAITTFRKQLEDFLNKLEQNMLAELDQHETKERQRVDQQIATLTAALHMLDAEYTLLDKARKDGRKETMFAADARVSTNLLDYESRLSDLEKYAFNVNVSFEMNKKLNDLQKDIKSLGSLKMSENIAKKSKKTVLLGRQIQSRREVNVRLADDKKYPDITGCVVMPNGYIVVCDDNNGKIKLLDNSLSLTDSLKLSSRPWDISVIDDNNAIVNLPPKKQLQYVQVFPQLRAGHVIQLDSQCWGVGVSGQEIYVSCHNNYNSGEVRVLDKQGNLKRRLGVDKVGSCLFSAPTYITVSTAGDKVFVSDWYTQTITCMKLDGSIIYQYKDKDSWGPHGLYCDDGDNILVCDHYRYSNNIKVIAADGKNYGTVLSYQDGLERPASIAYRKSDDTLVVGCYGLNPMFAYQVSQ